jgi:hypothetical protein
LTGNDVPPASRQGLQPVIDWPAFDPGDQHYYFSSWLPARRINAGPDAKPNGGGLQVAGAQVVPVIQRIEFKGFINFFWRGDRQE